MAHDKVSLVGHTKAYHQVLIKGDSDQLMGKRVPVRITKTTKHSMLAEIIGPPRNVATSPNHQVLKEQRKDSLARRESIISKATSAAKYALPAVLVVSLIYLRNRRA